MRIKLLAAMLVFSLNLFGVSINGTLSGAGSRVTIPVAGFNSVAMTITSLSGSPNGFLIAEYTTNSLNWNRTFICSLSLSSVSNNCQNSVDMLLMSAGNNYSLFIPSGATAIRVGPISGMVGIVRLNLNTSMLPNNNSFAVVSLSTTGANPMTAVAITANTTGAWVDVRGVNPKNHALLVDITLPGTADLTGCTLNIEWTLTGNLTTGTSAGSMSGDQDCTATATKSFGFHIADRNVSGVRAVVTNWTVGAGTGIPQIIVYYQGVP